MPRKDQYPPVNTLAVDEVNYEAVIIRDVVFLPDS